MTKHSNQKTYAHTVREIVENRISPVFRPRDTVPEMIRRMAEAGGGAGAVVHEDGRLIGLVTEREIVRRLFGDAGRLGERLDELSARPLKDSLNAWEVMITDPDVLGADDDIEDALDVISYFGYRYMPVTDPDGRCLGIVDARELHSHVQARTKALLESKDSLLAYFMSSEPYGKGARF